MFHSCLLLFLCLQSASQSSTSKVARRSTTVQGGAAHRPPAVALIEWLLGLGTVWQLPFLLLWKDVLVWLFQLMMILMRLRIFLWYMMTEMLGHLPELKVAWGGGGEGRARWMVTIFEGFYIKDKFRFYFSLFSFVLCMNLHELCECVCVCVCMFLVISYVITLYDVEKKKGLSA